MESSEVTVEVLAQSESRTEFASERLKAMAMARKPGALMPTIRSLRQELGISNSTLNAALTLLERQGILTRRQGSGIFVAENINQPHLLLICSQDILLEFGASPFWRKLIELSRQRAASQGEHLSLHFAHTEGTTEAPESALHPTLVELIESKSVQGVLTKGLPHTLTRWIESHGIPVVAFAGPAKYMVSATSPDLIYQGVHALAQTGCHRLSLVTPINSNNIYGADFLRQQSLFQAVLSAHGLIEATNPELSPPTDRLKNQSTGRDVYWGVTQGFEWAMQWFGADSEPATRPDGVISTDDMLAQGILMALHRLGITPGRGVQIATHSNRDSPVLLGWQDQIFRIEYDPGEIVQLLFETLEILMSGGKPEERLAHRPTEYINGYFGPEYMFKASPTLIPPAEIPSP